MAKNGMAGGLSNRNFRQSLSYLPTPNTEYSLDMSNMSGGLNFKKLPYELDTNESPKMENMWWQDGALCCRDGQEWFFKANLGTGYCCYEGLFNNYAFAHIGDGIYYFNPSDSGSDYRVFYKLVSSVPLDRGCWFTYGDYLMYKNRGGYYRIKYGIESISSRSYYRENLSDDITYIVGDKSESYPTRSTTFDTLELYPYVKLSALGVVSVVGEKQTTQWYRESNYDGWYYNGTDGIYKIVGNEYHNGNYCWKGKLISATSGGVFSYNLPAEFCYTPIMYINCSPTTGAGDSYQPENRLSSQKTFWYTAGGGTTTVKNSTTFTEALTQYSDISLNVGKTVATGLYGFEATVNWYSDSAYKTLINSRAVSYYNLNTGAFITSVPKAVSANDTLYWEVIIYVTTDTYRIPLSGGVTSVDKVTVTDQNSLTYICTKDGEGKFDYKVETDSEGYTTVVFNNPPPLPYPVQANTVTITCTKANTDAYNSVMNCNRAVTYGGTTDAVIVVGGCPAQPNAYFWNGNNTAMDSGYFPFDHYNLAGGSDEYITALNKQQGYLIIFKEHSIGRSSLSTTTISTDDNARVYITMDYTAINNKIGCDLPWSIQLCDNNLVFANSKQGVYILSDSSSAYENNVLELSEKVDGTPLRAGLLEDIRVALTDGTSDDICSYVGERRYWLVMNRHAWVWDFEISAYTDPSWFYFTNINAVSFIDVGVELYNTVKTDTGYFYLTADGNIVMFNQTCQDFDEAITKLYRTMTMNFGSYDRLKNIDSIVFVLADRKDKRNIVEVDYGIFLDNGREDETWHEAFALNQEYGLVDRRRVDIKRCHHAYIELYNDETHADMSVVRMQVYYKFCGRQRGNGR